MKEYMTAAKTPRKIMREIKNRYLKKLFSFGLISGGGLSAGVTTIGSGLGGGVATIGSGVGSGIGVIICGTSGVSCISDASDFSGVFGTSGIVFELACKSAAYLSRIS